MIKVAHEVPLEYMKISRDISDYDYALVHLFDHESLAVARQYFMYFYESLQQGREVILDNSAYELKGTYYDMHRYVEWINLLKPTYYVVPDVRNNSEKTIEATKEWMREYVDSGVVSKDLKRMVVVHGKNLEEMQHTIDELEQYCDKLSFSFEDYYFDIAKNKEDVGKVRYTEINKLHFTKPVHILGCILPQEFKLWKDDERIDTIDTSSPICNALESKDLTENMLEKPKVTINDAFLVEYTEKMAQKMIENSKIFKKFIR